MVRSQGQDLLVRRFDVPEGGGGVRTAMEEPDDRLELEVTGGVDRQDAIANGQSGHGERRPIFQLDRRTRRKTTAHVYGN